MSDENINTDTIKKENRGRPKNSKCKRVKFRIIYYHPMTGDELSVIPFTRMKDVKDFLGCGLNTCWRYLDSGSTKKGYKIERNYNKKKIKNI